MIHHPDEESGMNRKIVEEYSERNWRFIVWPQIGDVKGPKEPNWTSKKYNLDDYHDGNRVGLLTGQEVSPGEYLHDVDIDWTPGVTMAMSALPSSEFLFGRASKRISHIFYLTEEPISTSRYEDVDGTTLIELRGVKNDGNLGFQTMVPPSIWTKGEKREELQFRSPNREPGKCKSNDLKDRVLSIAIGLLVARNLNGGRFNHEARLAWAGFMLSAGAKPEYLIPIGEEIVRLTGNKDVSDIAMVVNSTQLRKEKGEPISGATEFRKLVGIELFKRINTWIGQVVDWARDKNNRILKDDQQNLRTALLRLGYNLEFNAFADKKILIYPNGTREVMDDKKLDSIYLEIDSVFHFKPSWDMYVKVINHTAWSTTRHPVREYLDSLEWDGKPRINTWLRDYGGAEDSEYLSHISAIILIAACRRIREPGCKFDEIMILEGPQGTGKSSALQLMCPFPDWFSDSATLDLFGKELIEATAGKWIIEVAELSGRSRAEMNQLKAMLSRQVDGPVRMAYAREPIERPRQFIFIGTVNDTQYLADATGSRRFWPVKTRKFDFNGITSHRDQLWAEANFREKAHEEIRLPEHLWQRAADVQEERFETDPWEDNIRTILNKSIDERNGAYYIERSTLIEAMGIEISRASRTESRRINEIMTRVGFKPTTLRNEDGIVVRGYVRPKKEDDKLQNGHLFFDNGKTS
jgi:hypothetical protein